MTARHTIGRLRRAGVLAAASAGATLDLAKTPSEDVDRRVQWRLGDIRFIAKHGLTGEPWNKEAQEQAMQRQFTIELRVDYADPAKNEPMKQALLKSARQIQATATLLSDGQKPDIAIFSEDFFVGKEVLDLMQYVKTTDGDEEAVSSELLAAMKENTDDKPDAY